VIKVKMCKNGVASPDTQSIPDPARFSQAGVDGCRLSFQVIS
jgi:hypothetical protein